MKRELVASLANWLIVTLGSAATITFFALHSRSSPDPGTLLLWLTLCVGAAFGLHFLNFRHIPLRHALNWIGYGMAGTILAFALQGILNGALLSFLGPEAPQTPGGAFALGGGAAVCQTLGKTLAIWLAFVLITSRGRTAILAAGLGVGLGFGSMEALLLSVQMVISEQAVDFLPALIERISAITFHIYSGGLIAVGFLRRSPWPVVIVLTLHTLMDGGSTFLHGRLPLPILESIFFLLSGICWLAWFLLTAGPKTPLPPVRKIPESLPGK